MRAARLSRHARGISRELPPIVHVAAQALDFRSEWRRVYAKMPRKESHERQTPRASAAADARGRVRRFMRRGECSA